MTTENLDDKVFQRSTEVFHPPAEIKTTGVLNLSRGLSQTEYDFLQTAIKSRFKRAFQIRNGPWVDGIIKRSVYSEDLLNILSFTSYVGRTFIKLDAKGITTPEKATSAIKGLEELFLLHVFNRESKPVEIAFGSATFRISDTEFYRVYTSDDGLKIQSGELTSIWNPPVSAGSSNQ